MSTINLRIYDLRKASRMSQKDLADELGVSVQTVSKWENHICMPDITILPDIAKFFRVTVDELLGLSPLTGEEYIPVRSGEKDYWDSRLDYLKASRMTMWNDDYFRFLVKEVWKIGGPVDVLDCGCGFGYMRMMLMPLLPDGSTYTGIDFNANLLREGEKLSQNEKTDYQAEFICDDFLKHHFKKHYDIVISHCTMRHVSEPQNFLKKMMALTRSGGLVAAIDVNRELESDGLYIDGMEYDELCSRTGFRKMWMKERECEGRDYAIGMRLPFMMREEGLMNVDVRINDRVTFVYPEWEDYAKSVECFLEEKNWRHGISAEAEEQIVRELMNHGMNRKEAENYCRMQRKIQTYVTENKDSLKYLHYRGLLISFGWKK